MLELVEIVKSYGAVRVLDKATLRCGRGDAICLAGANAAGKTTLLNIAAGLQKADSGSVALDGTVGYVQQETTLLDDLTVGENLQLWYAACGRPGRDVFGPDSVERRLGLDRFAKKRVNALSGGYKKRADIACALARDPDYLLMDEPFTALDLASRREITSLLRSLQAQGKGLLFSSHDPEAIAGAADAVAVLRDGAILRLEKLSGAPRRGPQILELLTDMAGLCPNAEKENEHGRE